MENQKKFIPAMCTHCGQIVDYSLSLSKGHAIILAKIYNFIKEKGINAVNLRKELEEMHQIITSNDTGNATQLKHWGLLKPLEEVGNYAITEKAVDFLKNDLAVNKKVIVNKGMHEENQSYPYEPEITVTFKKLLKRENPYWEGDYIRYGEIIK